MIAALTRAMRRAIVVAASWPLLSCASTRALPPSGTTTTAGNGGMASGAPVIRREFRGAWIASVANIDWPSKPGLDAWQQKAELVSMLDRAAALNLNAVLLQVRPAGDALYESSLEPWSEFLTGAEGRAPEPWYDPLHFAVQEAHRRGLELHAWFNPYRARHPSAKGTHARTHLSVTNPELVLRYGRYEWMDPGEPRVIDRTLRVMLDVVRRYDVDGIHIDDYFYPYPENGADGKEVPFPDTASFARYRAGGGTRSLGDWRRNNVDTLVQQLYERTKAAKPWVKVGISPFGIWRPGYPAQIQGFDSHEKLYGDARRWLREGWIDYFTPQLYWPIAQTAQSYPVLLDWWLGENVKGRHMWPGHNASRAAGGAPWGPDELNAQIRVTRATAATGDIHFSMRALMPPGGARRDSVLTGVATPPPREAAAGALSASLVRDVYTDRALVPATPWLSRGAPRRQAASMQRDAQTGDYWVVRESSERDIGGEVAFGWWTVRVRTRTGWQSWVLPLAQGRQRIGSAADPAPEAIIVNFLDRLGVESEACDLLKPRC